MSLGTFGEELLTCDVCLLDLTRRCRGLGSCNIAGIDFNGGPKPGFHGTKMECISLCQTKVQHYIKYYVSNT